MQLDGRRRPIAWTASGYMPHRSAPEGTRPRPRSSSRPSAGHQEGDPIRTSGLDMRLGGSLLPGRVGRPGTPTRRNVHGGGGQIGPCRGTANEASCPCWAYKLVNPNSPPKCCCPARTSSPAPGSSNPAHHSVDGIIMPRTAYGASSAFDSRPRLDLAAWPGENGRPGAHSFLQLDPTPTALVHFAGGRCRDRQRRGS